MPTPTEKPTVAILGAGVSGLTLAWSLKEEMDVTLFEKEERPGGWVKTVIKDDFLFDQGPHSLRAGGSEVVDLLRSLDLENELVFPSPVAKNRYLWSSGRLQRLPRGPISLLTSPLTRDLLPTFWREWRMPPEDVEDESIYHFFSRRFGSQLAERLVDPLMTGIFAGDIRKLSICACWPKLQEFEREEGSILRALWKKKKPQIEDPLQKRMHSAGMCSFRYGMQTLTDALAKKLADTIRYSSRVTGLKFTSEAVSVTTEDGERASFDHLYSTLPAKVLFPLLGRKLPELPLSSVVMVNLGYRRSVLKQKGFGYLVPSSACEPVLGVIFPSCVFPEQNRKREETRLSVMIGGIHHPECIAMEEEELISLAMSTLNRHLGIQVEPATALVRRAPDAIPQYPVGHIDWVSSIENELQHIPNLTILGTSFYGVALGDCISRAHLQKRTPLLK